MPRYEAPEILRSEVYLDVHLNDEGSGERSRWAFLSILLLGSISPSFSMMEVGVKDSDLISYHIGAGIYEEILTLLHFVKSSQYLHFLSLMIMIYYL